MLNKYFNGEKIYLAVLCISFSNFVVANEVTYDENSKTVSNWSFEASKHLEIDANSLNRHKHKRCIKLNNYWCLKDVGWNGRVAADADGHTAFKDGYFAARAVVRNFKTAYMKHGRKSALSIMSAYAPSSDCVGSDAARRSDGTCVHGNNDSIGYSKFVSEGITKDIHKDLRLFDEQGNATQNLILFVENLSAFETGGLRVAKKTIERGICMENASCMKQ